jgi:signal transduction histidine kinase
MPAVIALAVVQRFAADPLATGAIIVVSLLSLCCGSVVALRKPQHPAGALLAANAVAALAVIAAGDATNTPLAGDWMLLYLFLAELLLLMPTGRLTRRGHRLWFAVAVGMPVITVLFIALNAYFWRTKTEPAPLLAVALVLLAAFFAALVASVVSLPVRYRESDARDRLSLRWMFYAGTSVPLTLLLCWVSYLLVDGLDLVGFGLLVMFAAIPVAVTVALVRPQLFDIDEATLATMTVSAMSAGVLVVVSTINAIAGLTLVAWSPVVGIVATLGLGVLAVPLYRTLRRVIARLLYPDRERALAALRTLRTRMEAGAQPPEDIQQVLRKALRDPELCVVYRRMGDGAAVTLGGDPLTLPEGGDLTAVQFLGEDIGAILPSVGRASSLSRSVRAAAAPILDAVRMRAELRHAMEDVAASRNRLVLAGYEERRRLEQDLHDGAQQRLVALGIRLRVLQRTVPGADMLTESLDAAVAELATAVAELRQLAHGVRPSALDDGLMSALAELKRRTPHVIELDVEVDGVPDAVATTAYFVASEAITNAVKHAQAANIRIVARCRHGNLHLTITDDGRGGARTAEPGRRQSETTGWEAPGRQPASSFSGLDGLHDRVAAHGGRLRVDSPAGRGTTVEAVLPCVS